MAENGSARSIHVMVGEGPPSTPCGARTNKGVDGGPAAAMTCNGRCLHCIFMVGREEPRSSTEKALLRFARSACNDQTLPKRRPSRCPRRPSWNSVVLRDLRVENQSVKPAP